MRGGTDGFEVDMVVVTRHAKKRVKQRVHKNWRRAANNAFAKGIERGQICGGLRKYIDYVALKAHLDHTSGVTAFKIYYSNIYLFSGNRLVTVLHVPRQYVGLCWKLTIKNMAARKIDRAA